MMKRTLILLISLFLLISTLAIPVFAAAAESLDFQSELGTNLTMGDQTALTAVLGDDAVACTWTVSDEAVAKIISGNGTAEAVLEALAPGTVTVYGTAEDGLTTPHYNFYVAPLMTITLKDGTPLSFEEQGLARWLLVPEGADCIHISLAPAGTALDYYAQTAIEADDQGGYLAAFNDTRLAGDDLAAFVKGLDSYIFLSERAPGKTEIDYQAYQTGAYSYLSLAADHESEVVLNLRIAWQIDLPVAEDISVSGAVFYTPFSEKDYEHEYVLNKGSDQAVISFTPSADTVKVYLQDSAGDVIDNAVKVKNGVYSFTVKERDFGDEATLTRYLVMENEKGYQQTIAFTGARRLVDSPDALVDYLCIGSQYSDGGNQLTGIYGLYPEKSLIGRGFWWSPISLGNFGGYITYYYEDAITNNPRNPYGIDFIVYGNSNGGAGFSEPGNVLVSEDGETWYNLAGSEHYEDGTKWDYQVVYTKEEDGSTSANGTNLPPHIYPSPENYPLHDWQPGNEQSITVSGVLLPFNSSGNADFPAFGYADVHTNSSTAWGTGEIVTVDCQAKNPYLPVTTRVAGIAPPENAEELYEGAGDCFDLDWAVDTNGLPVEIEEIHYIKIQTASLTLSTGGIGEKSTEVNVIVPAKGSKAQVGVSDAPSGIIVDGTALSLEDGVYQYEATVQGLFTVTVEAGEDVNVYINNLRATSRDFALPPAKGLIRIIVQDGEKEPLIYLINIKGEAVTDADVAQAMAGVIQASGKDGSFSDTFPMSRAMLVASIYQLSGSPIPNDEYIRNIPSDAWYVDSLTWGVQTGLIKGSDTGYEPDALVTREQFATILYRYASVLGRDTLGGADLSRYHDARTVSAWAFDAMDWAISAGIFIGGSDGNLDPQSHITKSQAALVLQRFFAAMVE